MRKACFIQCTLVVNRGENASSDVIDSENSSKGAEETWTITNFCCNKQHD